MFMSDLLRQIADFLWFPVMLVLLLGSGTILSVRMKFLQITHIPMIYKNTLGSLFEPKSQDKRRISPFAAVTTALAGTMGVGNIAGVATGQGMYQSYVRAGNLP